MGGDAGSALTYPMEAGQLRKGSLVMLKTKPCKVSEVTTSKTGKHGHAKCHIVGTDIFTGKKYEELCAASHTIPIPFANRTEYQLLIADEGTGQVSLLMENGETKDDLNLPTFVTTGEPTDEDKKMTAEILKGMEDEKTISVTVLSACEIEKIVACKVTD